MGRRTTLTPLGGLAVLVVIVGIVLLFVGEAAIGIILIVLALIGLALGMFLSTGDDDLTRGSHAIDPPSTETPEQQAVEREAAWEHEEELYREKEQAEEQSRETGGGQPQS